MNQYRQPCNSCHQTQWQQQAAQPIVCPTQYRVRDTFLPRMQPVIHPIVNVNREHIVNVPQHFWTETSRTVPVNPPQQAFPMQPGFQMQPGMPMQPGYPMQQGMPMQQMPPMQQGQQYFPGQFR